MELVDIFEEKAPEVLTDLAKHIEVALEEKCQFSPENAVTQQESSQAPQIVVNFNPTINVNGNATQEAQSQIMQQLQMSAYEFEKLLNRVLDQRSRRAY
ncbi:hypothetical protein [Mannheimia haemolytica]|uniref:hypothetical protein n=1 Tax=Mannheimia haemolytica TaxID=75985 RepID=UPI0003584165|nr:hypothetical protein [Mannheimia haemolytica]AGQ41978.1 hypothetical protein J451_11090 [Mannheimia haemolytica D174]AGQ42307.1 hypothetical protein J451_12840 [Mannheimia haemolytica D174]EPZ01967.1 hypothetical protein L279_02260 [Mannheimia haemolytica D38]